MPTPNRFYNARIWHALGWPQVNVEYMRLNDQDTTSVQEQLDAHEAAADPHPQYTTHPEAIAIATGMAFLTMGA